MFGIGVGIGIGLRSKKLGAAAYDADAQAFFNRVTAAGGVLSATEKTAVNTLVLSLKSASIWTSIKAIYPIVGGSAAACAQNLKSSSFTGSFTSGWTFSSTGITGNGVNTYMDTFLNPNTLMNFNSQSYFIYKTTVEAATVCEYGVTDSSYNGVNCFLNPGYNTINEFVTGGRFTGTNVAGGYILSRNNSNDKKLFRNGSLFQTINNASSNWTLGNLYLGARNSLAGLNSTNSQIRFFSVGDGLSDTQASNFYTFVQAFQTTLSRAVGPQLVSDADAQAYIYRVYAAAGALTNTEANAVNQLTIDIKAAGIWAGMKAIYPMVGASAAACAQNLKSSSFTGTFTSGWTFASTGVTPNGTSAYFDTTLVPSTNLTSGFTHASVYLRTDTVAGNKQEIGCLSATNVEYTITAKYTGNLSYPIICGDTNTNYPSYSILNSQGFWVVNRENSTNIQYYNRATKVIDTPQINGMPTRSMYIGARNAFTGIDRYSDKQNAFTSIGDGLTPTQASNLYTAVQTFNTTLLRQV